MIAREVIATRLQAGDQPRLDGFLDEDETGRSAAAEVTESALAAARDAAEERKVPYIARLMATCFFDDSLDRSTALFLLATAERLSFRSYAILVVLGFRDDWIAEGEVPFTPANADAALSETMGLITAGLVVSREHPDAVNTLAVLGTTDIEPGKLMPSALGERMIDALGLRTMNAKDPARVAVRQIFAYAARAQRNGTGVSGGTY